MTLHRITIDCQNDSFLTVSTQKMKPNSPNAEELSGSCAKSNVGALEVVDTSLGEHGVVLELGLAQWRSVGRDEDKLGLAASHRLEGRLQAEAL